MNFGVGELNATLSWRPIGTLDAADDDDSTLEAQVLIVGAGPVGLTLAMDLAWRGVDVIVVERRRASDPPNVKCSQISARSMEVFRRLGIARTLREAGLPADYPNDVVSCTTVTGIELARVPIPSRAERLGAPKGTRIPGGPPPSPRIGSINFLRALLFAHAKSQPRIRIFNGIELESFSQDATGVVAVAHDLDSGEQVSIACSYLVGCDGGKSAVRKAIGAELVGTPILQRVQSTYIRAPTLLNRLPGKRAWLYFSLNPRRCGSTIAIDGRETWLIHNYLYHGESESDAVDRDWAIRTILGVGPDFRYEVISQEDFVGRRLVADRFRDRRVFICGDAAHLWIPHARLRHERRHSRCRKPSLDDSRASSTDGRRRPSSMPMRRSDSRSRSRPHTSWLALPRRS